MNWGRKEEGDPECTSEGECGARPRSIKGDKLTLCGPGPGARPLLRGSGLQRNHHASGS